MNTQINLQEFLNNLGKENEKMFFDTMCISRQHITIERFTAVDGNGNISYHGYWCTNCHEVVPDTSDYLMGSVYSLLKNITTDVVFPVEEVK